MKKNGKYYLISKEDLLALLERDLTLTILEADGVDNWSGYLQDFSNYREELIESYFSESLSDGEKERIDYIDIAEKILDANYQVSQFDLALEDDGR